LTRRSIGIPLTLGVVLLILVLSLAVAWHLQILVWDDVRAVHEGLSELDWVLLVLGAVFFVLIIVGVFWLCIWLVREIGVNQRQRAFIDAVTHEMRTPLASLQLHLETLQRHDPGRKDREEFLGRMRRDLERLDQTVEQVLTAARAEDSRSRPQLGSVALRDLLDRCIDGLRTSHGLPGDAIALEVDPGVKVKGDATELGVVFRNLLENAVKYSSSPVEVTVRVRAGPEGRVAVEIADRGIGIPTGELGKIFQRFYRVGRDVQRTASGLGLGLFIVRNLVRRQGGRVVARSEGWGQGSRFVVTLRAAR
jgi:signal transduction histidine kinase